MAVNHQEMQGSIPHENATATDSLPLFDTPVQQAATLHQIAVGLQGDENAIAQAQQTARQLYAQSLRDLDYVPASAFVVSAPYTELYLYATKQPLLEKMASSAQGMLYAGGDTALGMLTAPVAIPKAVYDYGKEQYAAYTAAQESGETFSPQVPDFARHPLNTLAGISDSQRLVLAEVFEIENDREFSVALERLHANQALARTLPLLAPGMFAGTKNVLSKTQDLFDGPPGGGAVLAGVGDIQVPASEFAASRPIAPAVTEVPVGLGLAATTGSAGGDVQHPKPLTNEALAKLSDEAKQLMEKDILPSLRRAEVEGDSAAVKVFEQEYELLYKLKQACESELGRREVLGSGGQLGSGLPVMYFEYRQKFPASSDTVTQTASAGQEPMLIGQLRAYYDYQTELKQVKNGEIKRDVGVGSRVAMPEAFVLTIGDKIDSVVADIAERHARLFGVDRLSGTESSQKLALSGLPLPADTTQHLHPDAAKFVHDRVLQVATAQPEYPQAGNSPDLAA